MRRVLVFLVPLPLLLTGCDYAPDPHWNPHAPWSPSLPRDVGIRVTDGHLDIWTGTPCMNITAVRLTFQPAGGHYYYLDSVDPDGGELERLRYGKVVPGFTQTRLPDRDFNWREATSLSFVVAKPDGDGMDAGSDLQEVFAESDKHPADTYYFQHAGWLDPAGVAAEDGKTFLTLCTPSPAEE